MRKPHVCLYYREAWIIITFCSSAKFWLCVSAALTHSMLWHLLVQDSTCKQTCCTKQWNQQTAFNVLFTFHCFIRSLMLTHQWLKSLFTCSCARTSPTAQFAICSLMPTHQQFSLSFYSSCTPLANQLHLTVHSVSDGHLSSIHLSVDIFSVHSTIHWLTYAHLSFTQQLLNYFFSHLCSLAICSGISFFTHLTLDFLLVTHAQLIFSGEHE